MFDKLNNMGRGFTFISLLTGITAVIIAFFILALIECNVSISLKNLFDKISRISFFELLVYVVCFCIGFFIHGIRYWGFDYYRRLYEKNKQKHKKTLFMKIVFYLFRRGTVVEEYLCEWKKNTSFAWIESSDKSVINIWNCARKIALEFPQVDVYKFYYHSEAFQCFDTVFFIPFFVTFCVGIYGTIGTFIVTIICKVFDKKYLVVLFFSLFLFFLHWVCKETSRSFARRFFLEIQVDLNVLHEKEEKERIKKTKIYIGKIKP